MRKSARRTSASTRVESFLLDLEEQSANSRSWFVYLFALADCSAFKVGFSCNPLQRLATFSPRYFEYFDLRESVLLELPRCDLARALEAQLKAELAPYRAAAPSWIPADAGGHTEWFGAVYFSEAEARLRAPATAHERAYVAFDLLRAGLERVSASFEIWACSQAQRVCDSWSCAERGYAVRNQSGALRDWLDAYRYFDLPLFGADPQVAAFVRQSARLSSM